MRQILKNITVVYTDNIKEYFNAIRITDNGILIGKMKDGKFADYGFIPKQNIKEIYNRKIKKEKQILTII